MDISSNSVDITLENKYLKEWPESTDILRRITSKHSTHLQIPEIVCRAVGGSVHLAIPAVAAIGSIYTAIILVDDLLDNDGRFEPLGLSKGDIANLALAFYSAGLDSILRSNIRIDRQRLVLNQLIQTMAQTALGQQMDTHITNFNEQAYWQITHQKSSPFFGAAFYTGAIAGGAAPEMAEVLLEIGHIYGEMIQIHDDLKDSLSCPASQDWRKGHISLPILFALTVNHPDREAFRKLHGEITDIDQLHTAQSILFRCGAVSYCIYALQKRYGQAEIRLDEIPLPDRAPINEAFQKIMDPVRQLFDKIGVSQPVLS